jgi:hypothetical protein
MHDLVLGTGWHAGLKRFRTLFEAHEHQNLGAQGLLIELDRLLAAAVEKKIGFDWHEYVLPLVT